MRAATGSLAVQLQRYVGACSTPSSPALGRIAPTPICDTELSSAPPVVQARCDTRREQVLNCRNRALDNAGARLSCLPLFARLRAAIPRVLTL